MSTTAKQCPSTLMLVNGEPPEKAQYTMEELGKCHLFWVYCGYTTDQPHEEHRTAGLIGFGEDDPKADYMYWVDGGKGVFPTGL